MDKQYILAIPNFSDGRSKDVIQQVSDVIRHKEGVKLITCEPEYEFNRTVLTMIGEPEPLKEALIEMAGTTYGLVDMTQQQGTHPRIGAQDTIPLIPLVNITMDEVKEIAEEIGQTLFDKYKVPIYFSGENARTEKKKSLTYIREGRYEGLKELLEDPTHPDYEDRKPDLSVDGKLDPKLGATIISSVEEGLTGFNIFLGTDKLEVAEQICDAVRGPSGGFTTVRSVATTVEHHDGVVVSLNMFDCELTPLYRVFEFVKNEAEAYGVPITGSEIIGPIRLAYIVRSLEHYLRLEGFDPSQIIEMNLIDM